MTLLVVTGDAHGEAVYSRATGTKTIIRTRQPYGCSFVVGGAHGVFDLPPGGWHFRLMQNGSMADVASARTVYIRRPLHARPPASLPTHAKDFLERERQELINGIVAIAEFLPGHALFCPGRKTNLAGNKIVQLVLAQALGLRVPATCVTNVPALAHEFFHSRRGDIVYKCLSTPVVEYDDGRRSMIYTSPVVSDDFSNVTACPSLFQEKISKRSEYRVAIVGNKAVAIRIDSQSLTAGRDDWRKVMDQRDIYSLDELPTEVLDRLILLHQRLRIPWGMVDLALTTTGEYVFFETNPDGAWLWLENALGNPAITELMAFAVSGAPDGSHIG